jgi:hypothetical protein
MAAGPDPTTLAAHADASGKEPEMTRYWAEFYARERSQEFLREAAEARLAAQAKQPRAGGPARLGGPKPGAAIAGPASTQPLVPKVVGRLLHFARRATV